MNPTPDAMALAERQVAEARTAALAEFQAARKGLRRRAASPLLIGGLLLCAVAVGCVALGRGKSKRSIYPESPGARSWVFKTAQLLLPLLMAYPSAARSAHSRRTHTSGTAP